MMSSQKTLKSSSKAQAQKVSPWWVIIASAVLLFALFFAWPSFAQTSLKAPLKEGQQNIRYDVYAGGIHALEANLNIDLSQSDRYSTSLTAKTYGLLGKLAPWKGTFESHGWREGNALQTEKHLATTTWRDDNEVKKYSYKQDGSFESFIITDDEENSKTREVDAKLTDNSDDVLTATLKTMQAIATTGKCEGSSDVFDGKRRFQLIFEQQNNVQLEASRWNVYGGPAVECTAEVKPMGGKWHEKPRGWMSIQEQGRERGTMPTIWFAKVKEGEPAIPVKVRVKTSYGTLFMHVTKYNAAGKSLPSKK